MNRINVEFMKAGARGISIVFASGDQGCVGTSSQCIKSSPEFPASSPYVTSVGGTMIKSNIEEASDTSSGAMISTGGGFSDTFEMPEYQRSSVFKYLNSSAVPKSMKFNNNGRAYPDISAISNNFPTVVRGKVHMVGGTSASAPLIAGIISLLNAKRIERGRPPMGFINPWLYNLHDKHPACFSDITKGHNRCSYNFFFDEGFRSMVGWDATTGLGTPNFGVLSKFV